MNGYATLSERIRGGFSRSLAGSGSNAAFRSFVRILLACVPIIIVGCADMPIAESYLDSARDGRDSPTIVIESPEPVHLSAPSHFYRDSGCTQPVYRPWPQDTTEEASSAFAHLQQQEPLGRRWAPPPVATAEEMRRWHDNALAVFRCILRLDYEETLDVDPDVIIRDEVVEDGIARIEVSYLLEAGLRVNATLLVPETVSANDPAPGVLFLHGHESHGRAPAVGTPPFDENDNYHHRGALELAREGFVVLAPDARSFGDNGSWNEHKHYAVLLNFYGRVGYGVQTADARRALSVLADRHEVRADALAVAGISMGGQTASYLMATDDRVVAGVIQGATGYHSGSLERRNEDPCQYIPGMAAAFDLPDVHALSAPRPQLHVNGDSDPILYPSEIAGALEEMQLVWDRLDASDALHSIEGEGKHAWRNEGVADWLWEVLE